MLRHCIMMYKVSLNFDFIMKISIFLNQAEHVHGDIDESADAMTSSIEELIGTIAKLMPNIGMIGCLTKNITEVVFALDDVNQNMLLRVFFNSTHRHFSYKLLVTLIVTATKPDFQNLSAAVLVTTRSLCEIQLFPKIRQ